MVAETETMVTLPVLGNVTYREWHQFIDGYYVGARWGTEQPQRDTQRQYWRTGYLIGTWCRYLFVVWLCRQLYSNTTRDE